MVDCFDKIIDYFDIFGKDQVGPSAPIDGYPGDYLYYKSDVDYGIFVRSDFSQPFRESCSGMVLESRTVLTKTGFSNGFVLSCSVPNCTSEFTAICIKLLETDRDELGRDPSQWFDKWKEMMGNATVSPSTYQVIAELHTLGRLIDLGYDPSWDGPNSSVCDISSKKSGLYFEVKSTIARNSSTVTMSEEFQANKADYLCFCRFEEDPSGPHSIDSICSELINKGFDPKILDRNLRKLNIRDTSLRTKSYHLLEVLDYRIDENFPNILDYFKDGVKPECIEKISYSINLSSMHPVSIPPVSSYNSTT
ncbi:hypothetical protein AUP07_0396 [methanogenic archaeon mixed culture ISO4-G1]|nr:hypothetical protein AUP07_0396 [methanogenic archaeon mixed culture ISO4-G1]